MSGSIKMDVSDFQEEFRKRVKRSKRTLAEVTNEAGFQILHKAQELTPKADLAAIESLGVTYRERAKNGKMLKRKQSIFTPTDAFKLIALKEMWSRGPSPRSFANAAALAEATRKKLARRKSSRGFIASGWVPAMRALIRRLRGGKSLSGPDAKRFPATKGGAIAANEDNWSPFVEITNATGMSAPGQSAASQTRVHDELETAWKKAIEHVTEDWSSYAAKQIENAVHGDVV